VACVTPAGTVQVEVPDVSKVHVVVSAVVEQLPAAWAGLDVKASPSAAIAATNATNAARGLM
jgi:hypothetical protein